MKPLKKKVSITLDIDIIDKYKQLSENCDRSFSQYVNLVLKDYYNMLPMALLSEIVMSFPEIEKLLSVEGLEQFIECDFNELYTYHLGIGTWIRNILIREKSDLLGGFIKGGVTEPDDMSMIIMQLFYIYLRTKTDFGRG